MKVSLAAQVLSHTVAAAINSLVSGGSLDSSALGTAHFAHLCNKIFDSVNGSAASPQGADGIRCQIRRERENLHLKFWNDAIRELKTWQVEKNSPSVEVSASVKKFFRPPCLTGWITTLEGLKLLWKKVKDIGLTYLSPRSLNQDAIEHLFGAVRSNCGSNVNPTVPQFVAALKTSMINGLAFVDLKRSNCEKECEPDELLHNLQDFLNCPSDTVQLNNTQQMSFIVDDTNSLGDLPTAKFSLAYVSGSIARRVLKDTSCDHCKLTFLAAVPQPDVHCGIIFKEYSDKKSGLMYPSEDMVHSVHRCVETLEQLLPQVGHTAGVQSKLISALESSVDWDWLISGCSLHSERNQKTVLTSVFCISIRWWCTRQNRELGKFHKKKADQRKLKILRHE